MPLKFSTLFQSHLQVSILSEDDFEIKSKIYSIKLRLVLNQIYLLNSHIDIISFGVEFIFWIKFSD
jgi:hypothetical protein